MTRKRKRILWSLGLCLVIVAAYGAYRGSLRWGYERRLAAVRAEGYPTSLDELRRWYPDPPPEEDAFHVYATAFEAGEVWVEGLATEDLPFMGGAELPPPDEALPEAMLIASERYLKAAAPILKSLHEGAARPHVRFPLRIDPSTGLPELAKVRYFVNLLELEAVARAERGDTDGALDSLHAMLRLGNALAPVPSLTVQLVRSAVQGMTLSELPRILCRCTWSDEQLRRLDEMLRECEEAVRDSAARAMAGERVTCIDDSAPGHAAPRGFLGEELIPSASGTTDWKNVLEQVWDGFAGVFARDRNGLLDCMGDYLHAAGQPVRTRLEGIRAAQKKVAGLPESYFITKMLGYVWGPALQGDLRAHAEIYEARAIVAIERRRLAGEGLPESLDELVPRYLESVPPDPFDGGDLRYRRLDSGYVVYSVYMDGRDDGGVGVRKGPFGATGDLGTTMPR